MSKNQQKKGETKTETPATPAVETAPAAVAEPVKPVEATVNWDLFSVVQIRGLIDAGIGVMVKRREMAKVEHDTIANELRSVAGAVGMDPSELVGATQPPVAGQRRGRKPGSKNKVKAESNGKPHKGRKVKGSDKGNIWTLHTGTRELLYRHEAGLELEDIAKLLPKELKFVSTAKDFDSFKGSVYVSGVQKVKKADEGSRQEDGKIKLNSKGRKNAEAHRKQMEAQ